MTGNTALILNLTGLFIGLVAAVLMYYFPPHVTLYTKEGAGHITLTNNITDDGKRKGKIQSYCSTAAPWLLALSFFLQLIAALLPTHS